MMSDSPSCVGPAGGMDKWSGPSRDGNAASARDLFPLPLPEPLNMVRGLNRRASQRMARQVRIQHEQRELVSALNWMHLGTFDFRPAEGCSSMQNEVLGRLRSLVVDAGDLDDCSRQLSQEAALAELLRGQDGYSEPATPASLAPFNLELISLPSDLSDAPHALDLLGDEDRRYLEVQERMLLGGQSDVSSRVNKPYWDPALKHNPRNYRRFIRRLCDIKYLDFTLEPSNHAGVFFVWKSDRQKIRLIVDARPANSTFVDPPGVSLATAETFSKIEVAGDSEDDSNFGLFAGLSDVKDCFHRIRQPRWLSKHFCFLPVEARHVRLTGQVLDGKLLRSSDLVYPMPGSLCMGFTWSLYFAQRINERVMAQVPQLQCSDLIHDRGGPPVFYPSSLASTT